MTNSRRVEHFIDFFFKWIVVVLAANFFIRAGEGLWRYYQ